MANSTEYIERLPMNGKIAYALSQIRANYKDMIAEYLADEDGTNATEIAKKLPGILSQMEAKGDLATAKQARNDVYSLQDSERKDTYS